MARTYKRDSRGRFAGGGGSSGGGKKASGGKRSGPKTTSARGRALASQRRAAVQVRANRGGTGPSARAVRSMLTAQRARAFYEATGTGKKRSARRAVSSTAKAKAARAETRAKRQAVREKAAGRPKARVVAGSVKRVPGSTSNDIGSRARRTKFPTRSITPDVSDREPRKKSAAAITRKRARDVYGNQLLKGTGRDGAFNLDMSIVRAPFGRFSTVSNPAPAKSFPSQAPLRTKKGEQVARKGRASAAARRKRR